MGLIGFTSFIRRYSDHRIYFNLSNCLLIIDSSSFIYKLHSEYNINVLYGGDYEAFREALEDFVALLERCNVEPIFVLDGCKNVHKKDEQLKRAKDKLKQIRDLQFSQAGCKVQLMSMCTQDCMISFLRERKIRYCYAARESDQLTAALAIHFDCPVLTQDSDFYFYHTKESKRVKVVLLHEFPFNFRQNRHITNIMCSIFNVASEPIKTLNSSSIPRLLALVERMAKTSRYIDYASIMTIIHNYYTDRELEDLVETKRKEYCLDVQTLIEPYAEYLSIKNFPKRAAKFDDFLDYFDTYFQDAYVKGVFDSRPFAPVFSNYAIPSANIENLEEKSIQEITLPIRTLIVAMILHNRKKSYNGTTTLKSDRNGSYVFSEYGRVRDHLVEFCRPLINYNNSLSLSALLKLEGDGAFDDETVLVNTLILGRRENCFIRQHTMEMIYALIMTREKRLKLVQDVKLAKNNGYKIEIVHAIQTLQIIHHTLLNAINVEAIFKRIGKTPELTTTFKYFANCYLIYTHLESKLAEPPTVDQKILNIQDRILNFERREKLQILTK